MGRLIDASNINNCVMMHKSDWGIFATDIGNAIDSIVMECPTVEAIPKDQYEARLKAILVELQLEIEELEIDCPFGFEPVSKTAAFYDGVSASSKVIQQKIDSLEGNK